MESVEEHLLEHGVKPTAVRILVWRVASEQRGAFSLSDMEDLLVDMDKSSIFRALRLFAEHRLLHEIDDGSGFQKYCVCRCCDDHHINHVHFTCRSCGKTYCLEDMIVPLVAMPEGFVMEDAEFVVKGLCPKCKNK